MYKKFLIIQTAFPGDVILTLPLLQVLKASYPESEIDFLCIPKTSEILEGNPLISKLFIYDKRNSGISKLNRLIIEIRKSGYDVLISPHRSTRSSLISFFSGAKKKISFDKSALNFFYDEKIKYRQDIHEIQRNLRLLQPLNINESNIVKPELYISNQDKDLINNYLKEKNSTEEKFICLAPASEWFTKRYPKEKFVRVCDLLAEKNMKIFLLGGESDKNLCAYITDTSINKNIINTSGNFTFKQSAELIRRSDLLITNDSAPLHLANAVGTKVLALFGATVPEFGFYPYGSEDKVLQTFGLNCRPCSIHGGNECPVKTFDCLINIDEELIVSEFKRFKG